MILALSDTSVELGAGERWIIRFAIYDDDGNTPTTDPAPVINLTFPPNGEATTLEAVVQTDGTYKAAMASNYNGRLVANVYTELYSSFAFVAFSHANPTSVTGMPTVAAVRAYAGSITDGEDSIENIGDWENADIQAVLDSELSQQRMRCDVGAVYPPDLYEAACRRTVRALNLRSKVSPTDFSTVVTDEATSFVPYNDPEIRRLENPYRKVVLF